VALDLVGQLTPLAGKFSVHAHHTGILRRARLSLAFESFRSHLLGRHGTNLLAFSSV